ncbi:hypothetical protein HME9302_00677 [Alteripontixanthobacter maritimus]|uniref:Uncharacterized protein n=2 Tax=Alteripontixanthobacter maritimus TaxID=2161824 RepID=A0A369Q890_9SPHN|nr:hypothetical protein HME9302_00677 [Alteripontixanthobacter maritimus]
MDSFTSGTSGNAADRGTTPDDTPDAGSTASSAKPTAKQAGAVSVRTMIGLIAAAFLAGAVLLAVLLHFSGYTSDRPETAQISTQQKLAADSASIDAALEAGAADEPEALDETQAVEAVEAAERVAETQGGLDQRLAAAEQRIGRLDLQAQAASGNAARAEGLLIAFAARRTLDRGAELGYLADQLRLRFGDAKPNAVRAVIEGARDPVTLDGLIARLDGLAPVLETREEELSFARLRRELGEVFVVRRENTPSPQPRRRLERARFFLESGRVPRAIQEVQQLPGAASAQDWITDAQRYARIREALDLLETTAILETRQLRDADAQRVEQPSPAQ